MSRFWRPNRFRTPFSNNRTIISVIATRGMVMAKYNWSDDVRSGVTLFTICVLKTDCDRSLSVNLLS